MARKASYECGRGSAQCLPGGAWHRPWEGPGFLPHLPTQPGLLICSRGKAHAVQVPDIYGFHNCPGRQVRRNTTSKVDYDNASSKSCLKKRWKFILYVSEAACQPPWGDCRSLFRAQLWLRICSGTHGRVQEPEEYFYLLHCLLGVRDVGT